MKEVIVLLLFQIVRKIPACDRTGPKTRIIYRLTLFTFTPRRVGWIWIYNAFYRDGIKVVPVLIYDDYRLTPATLAALILQDGSRQKTKGSWG